MKRTPLAAALLGLCLIAGGQTPAEPVFQAIRNNDLPSLKQQLSHGADVNAKDRRGVTPLLYAAAFGSLEAVRALLDAGADMKAKNAFDATALIWAAGQPEKA
ncbi:MAG TPA: ankyrin repeat domain-containing protein, partial [Bryobacteraceae bacterium]